MFEIISVSRGKSVTKLTVLSAQGKQSFSVLSVDDRVLGCPEKGTDLPEKTVEKLFRMQARHDAVLRAFKILSYSDKSAFSLEKILERKGVSSENAGFAVSFVTKMGYLQEKEQIERALLRLFSEKKWGPFRLCAKLRADGYRREDIDTVLASLTEKGKLDFDGARQSLSNSFAALGEQKVQEKLYRMGYMPED